MCVSEFVSRCKDQLYCTTQLARQSLGHAQTGMKRRFDKRAVERQFKPGDKVLVLLPVPGSALIARFTGPYMIERKVSDTNYILCTPDRRRRTRLCHINMLKSFHSRDAGDCCGGCSFPSWCSAGAGA